MSQEYYGAYTTRQLADLFLAALYEDLPDEPVSNDLALDQSTAFDDSITITPTKRKREPSPVETLHVEPLHADSLPAESFIDLTSDASQPSSFQEVLLSIEQEQVTIESKAPVTEKDIHDTNKDTCPEDDISTTIHNAILEEMEIEHTVDLFTIEQEQVNEEDVEIEQSEGEDKEELFSETEDTVNAIEAEEDEEGQHDKILDVEAVSEEHDSDIDELDESSEDEGPNVEMESEESSQDNSPADRGEENVNQSELTEEDDIAVVEEQLQSVSPQPEEPSIDRTPEMDVTEEEVEQFPSINIDLLNELIEEESVPIPTSDEIEANAVTSEPNVSATVEKANDTVESSDDDDNDVFYDVEYEDIDENGNFSNSQTKQNKASQEDSLDPFKESAIEESQIIEAYQALEADSLETDVRDTQVKEAVSYIDLSTTQAAENEDLEENQVEFEDAPEVLADARAIDDGDISPEMVNENETDQPVAQTEGGDINNDAMEDVEMEEVEEMDEINARLPAVQVPRCLLDIIGREDLDSEDDDEEDGLFDLCRSKQNALSRSLGVFDMEEDTDSNEEDSLPEWPTTEEIKRIASPRKVTESEMSDVEDELPFVGSDIEKEKELDIESEDEEELSFTLPESLPIPHENTQVIKEHWRDEELKLESTFEPSRFAERIRHTAQLKDVMAADKSLTMWWYDALEENKKTLFLFGKVFHASTDKYVSCCMIVENIQRELYILPRSFKLDENGDLTEQKVTIEDVKAELAEKLASKEIEQYTMEVCTKKYAFELPDIPRETEYIKLCYPFKEYKFPQGTSGKTFSHMFGTSVSVLEHFIIHQKMMGPCWLKFDNVVKTSSPKSWCAVEGLITRPGDCTVIKDHQPTTPPLTIMSLSLHTYMNFDTQSNEISAIGGFVCPDADIDNMDTPTLKPFYRFSITNVDPKETDAGNDERALFAVSKQEDETNVLYAFLAQLQVIDPDIIVGHNFTGVDLDILLHRMKKLNIVNWSRIGRRRRDRWPKLQAGAGGFGKSSFAELATVSGRLLCDTYLASQDLVKSKSYHLTQLALSQLNIVREDFDKRDPTLYNVDGSKELEIARHCSFDAYLAFSLAIKLQILPLTKRLTNLSGNLWSRSMNGGRSERNEYLLLHTFNEQNYVCPDRPMSNKRNNALFPSEDALELEKSLSGLSDDTPSYSGGLVLEPKVGFYDKYVLLLDFNSLYPSIMQEYNICFTTVERSPKNLVDYREVPSTPDADVPEGILPGLVRLFVKRRQHVKQLMKDHTISKSTRMQYDIEQMALKLTANSMYGCLGSSTSRFYARPLAMLITHKGREILRSTVDSAESLGFNVVYGDTDSIMINTNETKMSRVKKIGEKMKEHVNKKYKLLEIDVDGYFRHTLLLKKKKYAALLVKPLPTGGLEEFVEVKGLDLVRRDWCELSHNVSSHVLKLILSDASREVIVDEIFHYLKSIVERIHNKEFPLNDFIIRKQLTKNLEEYSNQRPHPHVHVAKEMRRQGINIKSGDIVPYVICTRKNDVGKLFNEPCMPESCSAGSGELDIDWYLSKQILPPVNRLCAPIDGIDLSSLLDCVGLSKNEVLKKARLANTQSSQEDEEVDPDLSIYMEDSRYYDPEILYLDCSNCHFKNEYCGPIKSINDSTVILGFECERCRCQFNPGYVKTKVQSNVIHYINRYYSSGYICDQVDCDFATRFVPLHTTNCPACAGGLVKEYSAKMLHAQITQLRRLFDISLIKWDSYDPAIKDTLQDRVSFSEVYDVVKEMMDNYLSTSDYNFVNITDILRA